MKPIENQTFEWKQSWRDEYLKWICAFSNSQRIQRTETYPISRPAFREALLKVKIGETCRLAGIPAPYYRVRTNEVMIGFKVNTIIGDRIGNRIGDAIGVRIGDAIGDAFVPNKTQKDILALMRKNPSVSARKIAETVQIALRNVETNIKRLKEAGLVTRAGSGRAGHWEISASISASKGTSGTENGTDAASLEKHILTMIEQTPNLTFNKLSESIKLSRRTVSRMMKSLQDQGKNKRVGSARTGHWEIAK